MPQMLRYSGYRVRGVCTLRALVKKYALNKHVRLLTRLYGIAMTVLASTLGCIFLGLWAAAARVTKLVTGHALVLVYTCFSKSAVSVEQLRECISQSLAGP